MISLTRALTHARMHSLLADPLMLRHNGALLAMQLWISFYFFKHGNRERFVVLSEPRVNASQPHSLT